MHESDTSSSMQCNTESHRNELLTMAIELDGGEERLLHFFEGQNPLEVSQAFCNINGIDIKFATTIEEKINQNLKVEPIHTQVIPEELSRCSIDDKITATKPLIQNDSPIYPIPHDISDEEDIADEYQAKLKLKEGTAKSAHKSYLGVSSDSLVVSATNKSSERNRTLQLYQNGLKSKEQLKLASEKELLRKSIKELDGVTWTPNISKSMKVKISKE